MVPRPDAIGVFKFIAISCLRAQQLTAGCVPRVDGVHTVAVLAQLEVAAGKIHVVASPPTSVDA